MKTCALRNLGCKVNEYETDAMKQQMAAAGYRILDFEEKADVYIINTCSVTNIADRKSRQMIHQARKRNPEAVIVAAGCYVQARDEEVLREGYADIILGNDKKGHLPELVSEFMETRQTIRQVDDLKKPRAYEELSLTDHVEHTRAFVKIQDGCNQFCSYCIIPFTRGRVRSRKKEDILQEIRFLAQQGYKEVVLTGIHISSYGMDFRGDTVYQPEKSEELLDLLEELEKVPGLMRVRLGSLEPRIITPDFVKRLRGLSKFCPHFHLSLQSGCDETLKRMNRRYTTKEYKESVELLRDAFNHPAITTDVITGFAGETDEEFAVTKQFLSDLELYEIHVFPFSVRKGTAAEKMPGQNPESVKKARSRELLDLTAHQSRSFREWYLEKEAEVLLEETEEWNGTLYTVGHTREYVKVAFPGMEKEKGQLVTGILKGFLEYDKMLAESKKIE